MIRLLLSTLAISFFIVSPVKAQQPLSKQVQSDILLREISAAIAASKADEALSAIKRYRQLGVAVPPKVMFVEAQLALIKGDALRAEAALTEYLRVATKGEPSYDKAIQIYPEISRKAQDVRKIIAEKARVEADRRAAAERAVREVARLEAEQREAARLQRQDDAARQEQRAAVAQYNVEESVAGTTNTTDARRRMAAAMLQLALSESMTASGEARDAALDPIVVLQSALGQSKAAEATLLTIRDPVVRIVTLRKVLGTLNPQEAVQAVSEINREMQKLQGIDRLSFADLATVQIKLGDQVSANQSLKWAEAAITSYPEAQQWQVKSILAGLLFTTGRQEEGRALFNRVTDGNINNMQGAFIIYRQISAGDLYDAERLNNRVKGIASYYIKCSFASAYLKAGNISKADYKAADQSNGIRCTSFPAEKALYLIKRGQDVQNLAKPVLGPSDTDGPLMFAKVAFASAQSGRGVGNVARVCPDLIQFSIKVQPFDATDQNRIETIKLCAIAQRWAGDVGSSDVTAQSAEQFAKSTADEKLRSYSLGSVAQIHAWGGSLARAREIIAALPPAFRAREYARAGAFLLSNPAFDDD